VALSALILAGEYGVGERPPLLFKIAGQTLLERLIRQVSAAGATHIVLMVTALPADIVAIVDSLSAEGVAIDLARDAADVADRIHPEEKLLVVDGPLIIDQSWFTRLCAEKAPALITIASTSNAAFERIDAKDDWIGLACFDGGILRTTASQLGDWALGPTLLRRAVQMNAQRIRFDAEDDGLRAVRPLDLADLGLARQRLGKSGTVAVDGWLTGVVSRTILPFLGHFAMAKNISYFTLEMLSILLYLSSLGGIFIAQPFLVCVCFFLAGLFLLWGRYVKSLAVPGRSFARVLGQVRSFGLPLLPMTLAWSYWATPSALVYAILTGWFVSQWALTRRQDASSSYRCDAETCALIFAVSGGVGLAEVGFGVCIGLLFIEQSFDRRKISVP
jgi:hypothetical protein